ncbi:hypothetical protein [Aliiroseovarius crassostreae]
MNPINLFVQQSLSDRDGQVEVGYRKYPDGPMQEVQALLDSIVREAVAE